MSKYRFTQESQSSGCETESSDSEGEKSQKHTEEEEGEFEQEESSSSILSESEKEKELLLSFQRRKKKDLTGLIESLMIDGNELLEGGNPITGGKREFQKMLGKGGFGSVFMCNWSGRGGGIDVAVKVFSIEKNPSKVKKSLVKEFEVMVSLFHANVTRVFGFFVGKTRCGIVMELCNDNVYDYVVKRYKTKEKKGSLFKAGTGRLSSGYLYQKLVIMREMAMGVNYLHTVGVVHRDIKPSNFLVDFVHNPKHCGLRIKVCDFGLSKFLDENSTHMTLESGSGTIDYIAPELFFAMKNKLGVPYSKSSDIFALGVSFHHVLFYRVPGYQSGKERVVFDDGRVPSKLTELLKSMLEVKRKKRPSIDFILSALGDLMLENRWRKKMEKRNWEE